MKHYYAFLLRIWFEDSPCEWNWRASLEDPHTRSVQVFHSIEELFAYLQCVPPEFNAAEKTILDEQAGISKNKSPSE